MSGGSGGSGRSTFGRIPPHSTEAEESIVGGIFLENSAFDRVGDLVTAEDFYVERNARIFGAMAGLAEGGLPMDAVTVSERLKQHGELARIGGVAYLAELSEKVATAANIEHYARIVREQAMLRRMIRVSTEIVEQAFDATGDAAEFIDRAERAIFEVSERSARTGLMRIEELIPDAVSGIEALIDRKSEVTGVPTGFGDLDRLTAGFQPCDLIIVAGRPSMGKTAFCLNVAEHVAIPRTLGPEERVTGVAIFSLEMSREQVVMRMLCSQASLSMSDVRIGRIQSKQYGDLARSAGRLGHAPIYIDDTPSLSATELRARARRLKRDPEANLGLIIVDYLQLMRGSGREDNREQEISSISRSLKALAKELHVPVIALSQLNRQVELRSDKRPVMADLRECVTGDTLVMLAEGRRVPVRDLLGQSPTVVSMQADGSLCAARCDAVWRVGRRAVWQIELASGRKIRATSDHRLLGTNGWKRVRQLRTGDHLALAWRVPEPSCAAVWPAGAAALLGHVAAEGQWSGASVRMRPRSAAHAKFVERVARAAFAAEVRFADEKKRTGPFELAGARLTRWLAECGCTREAGSPSGFQRIPPSVYGLGHDDLALFLRHLCAGAGAIGPGPGHDDNRDAGASVRFSVASEMMAADVAALLMRFGVVGRIVRLEHPSSGRQYRVVVREREELRRYARGIGAFATQERRLERLVEDLGEEKAEQTRWRMPVALAASAVGLLRERGVIELPIAEAVSSGARHAAAPRSQLSRATVRRFAEKFDDNVLRTLCASDVYWDRIVSIAPAGRAEVYDLTVPETASWLADGIVTHNSGAIEQDADLITFIYRDEVYHRDTESPGIAEIIIAKQRNGPTGLIELAFEKEFTRFRGVSHRDDDPHGQRLTQDA